MEKDLMQNALHQVRVIEKYGVTWGRFDWGLLGAAPCFLWHSNEVPGGKFPGKET